MNTGAVTPLMTAKSLCYTSYRDIVNSILFQFIIILFAIMQKCPIKLAFIIWFAALILSLSYVGIKYLRTGTIDSIMKQIAIVHLETLSSLGLIKTSVKHAGINAEQTPDGIFITCRNLPADENNTLINSLKEFLDPIENPRYILIKRDVLAGFINQTDYFTIPALFSSRKSDIEIFRMFWQKYIGTCEIVYTRSQEGRKLLLRARKLAFSQTKREPSKKLSRWS